MDLSQAVWATETRTQHGLDTGQKPIYERNGATELNSLANELSLICVCYQRVLVSDHVSEVMISYVGLSDEFFRMRELQTLTGKFERI